jgi:capsular polysaccharide transport system permease protein
MGSLDPKTGRTDAPPRLAPRFRTLRTLGALILREMGASYGRSPGGYLWAILSPVGAIAVMTVAFSIIVRTPSLGTSFVLFYATGFLPFLFYMTIAQKTALSIRYSRPLLAYPGVTWVDAVLARFLLNLLTETMVFCIVITAILMLAETHAVLDVVPIIEGLALAALTGLGVGLINCLLIGYAPVWEQAWSIITRPLFIISGVFFLYEDMPPLVQDILWWNPLMHATSWVRTGFYPSYHASFVSLAYGFGLALGLIALGLALLRRGYRAGLQR